MKRICFVAVVLMAACSIPAAVCADTVQIESQIDAVTVFSDRALVVRKAKIEVMPGEYELVFGNLPVTILDNSVGAEGQGAAKVVITGLRIEKMFLEEAGLGRVKELEEEIEAVKDEIKVIDGQQEVLMSEREFLESLRVYASEKFSDELTRQMPGPEEFSRFLEFFGGKLNLNYSEFHKLALDARARNKRLRALKKEMAEIENWQPDERKKVSVAVDVKSKGGLELELSYVTYGATWIPSYTVRAFPKKGEVGLTYYGMVRQKTGSDWQGVRLSLSTAKPAVYGKMPELVPWYLRKREVSTMYKVFGERAPAAPMPMLTSEREERFIDEGLGGVEVAVAEVQQKGTSVSYNIVKLESIPSDGNKYKTTISINTFPAQMSYVATPELSEYVYLKAEVENNTDLHYLAGGVDIFMDQQFVGHAGLDSIAPSEEFDLYLGIDEGMKIKKELEVEKEEEKGLIGKARVMSYKYKITAENYKDEAVELTIKDRAPVSQHEDIVVKLGKFSVPPVEDEEKKKEFKEKGLIEWQITLQPQEEKEIVYSFTVTCPRDMEITGLYL